MAFEAWLIRRAMQQTFTDQQVADLRLAFNAGWAARADAEFVARPAPETSADIEDRAASHTTHTS